MVGILFTPPCPTHRAYAHRRGCRRRSWWSGSSAFRWLRATIGQLAFGFAHMSYGCGDPHSVQICLGDQHAEYAEHHPRNRGDGRHWETDRNAPLRLFASR